MSWPLASALRIASGLLDVAAWAFMALIAQLAAYALVALLLKDFSKRINRGEMAAATVFKVGPALRRPRVVRAARVPPTSDSPAS